MGSRGQALKADGFISFNYKSLMRYNNVRFVMLKDMSKKNIKLPEMSNSKWAVYATLGSNGEIKSISYYNGNRKKYKEIDFDHFHDGIRPHVHVIDPNAKNLRSGATRGLTSKERKKVYKIMRFHKKHDLKSKYEGE